MMRAEYFRNMEALAISKRAEHKVITGSLDLRTIQRIYKSEQIRIDPWDIKSSRIRAAYFCDSDESSVMVNINLPREPKLFALVHELKHHYVDRPSILDGKLSCGAYNENEIIEIGAEVFAAEFIYPQDEMRELAERLGISNSTCSSEKVVEFKRSCPALIKLQVYCKTLRTFRVL